MQKRLEEFTVVTSQAERVIELFAGAEIDGVRYRSGAQALAIAIRLTGGPYRRQAIYQWTWSREKHGTGGIIPTRAIPHIERAARALGIVIPPGILDPRVSTHRERREISPQEESAE